MFGSVRTLLVVVVGIVLVMVAVEFVIVVVVVIKSRGSRSIVVSWLIDTIISLLCRYTKAVCHLLLIDYVCLPEYSLPENCHFLNASRELAVDALKKGVHLPAMPSNP